MSTDTPSAAQNRPLACKLIHINIPSLLYLQNAVEVPATLPPNVEALLQSPLKLERPNDTAVVTADSASQSTLHTEQNWKGLYKVAFTLFMHACASQHSSQVLQKAPLPTADMLQHLRLLCMR